MQWDGRAFNKATMLYRITNNLVAIPAADYLRPQGASVSTRGHSRRFLQQWYSKTVMKESFFPTATVLWNRLPDSLVTAPTLNTFKAGIAAALA